MARDAQRSRLYRAERVVEASYDVPRMSIEQAKALVDFMLNDSAVRAEFKIAKTLKLDVKASSGQGGYAYGGWSRNGTGIKLGRWARQEHVVIHELCHHLAGLHAQHDYSFANVCWWMTARFMGAEAGEKLRKSYIKHDVQYQGQRARREPPRALTATQRKRYLATFNRAQRESVFVPAPPRTLATAASTPSSDVACTDCGTTTKKVGSGGRFKTPLCNTDYRKRMAAR